MSRGVAVPFVLGAMAFGALQLGASCGQQALGVLPGVVDDPANLTLRRDILKYGTDRMCAEMSKRSMPLRLRQEDPAIGRFFATRCNVRTLSPGHLGVEFGGFGYVWTNLTGRLTFEASGSVGYDTDFLMDGATMYVYFRARPPPTATFTARVVERPQGSLLLTGLPLFGPGTSGLGDIVGAAIVRGEIGKGFTVVRDTNGSAQLGLGVVGRGEHPALTPFEVRGGKTIVANDRTELHRDQRDFVGPIEVREGGQLVVDVVVDGAPAADVLLLPRGIGEAWLQQYALQAAPTPPPGPALLDEPVTGGVVWKRTLTPPAGLYYLVLDNTATAGRTAPSTGAGDDRAALVSYGVAVDP